MEIANCDKNRECMKHVTHVDQKGFVYCSEHAPESDSWRRVRKMAAWERELVEAGQPIPSYARTRKPVTCK